MDKIKHILLASILLFSLLAAAQQADSLSTRNKSGLSLGGMRFSTVASLTYNYRLWQNKQASLRTGLQAGFGYGGELDRYKGFALPLGIYMEYGKKHRIGFDGNIIYLANISTVPGTIPGVGDADLRVLFDQGAITTSLYYSYNFGANLRYNAGLGYNYQTYFGSNYGIENQEPSYFAPFIFFGVRF